MTEKPKIYRNEEIPYEEPEAVERAVNAFKRLPGIGDRTARRIIYWLLGASKDTFDEFVDSQVQFIQDQRVLDKAMESDLWRKSGGGNRPEDQLDFRKNLRVTRRGQIIRIAYWDPDISVTSSAVRAVIDAYMQIYGEKESQGFQERVQDAFSPIRVQAGHR